MELLLLFKAQLGDFEFLCIRERDGTCQWSKKLINRPDTEREEIPSVELVPVPIMSAFAKAQVAKQASRAA